MSETTTQPSAAVATETAAPAPEVRIDFNDGVAPSPAELAGETTEPSSTPEPSEPAPAKTVPLAALHEERERRKELAEQVKREAAERQKLEGRFEELKERFMAPPAPPPEIPSLDVDPVANFDARLRQQEQARQQTEAERLQQTQIAAFHNAVGQAEAQYRAQVADYDAAVEHLQRSFATEAAYMGVSAGDIARSVAVTALQNGRNPAEVAYQMAKARGYAGPKPAAATAADGMAAIERGQAATGSVANAPAQAEANLTASRLANMSLGDFAKVSDADWRKMMGG